MYIKVTRIFTYIALINFILIISLNTICEKKTNWYLLNPLSWVCRYISRELALGYITPLPVLSRDGISQSFIMCDVSNVWSWHAFTAFRLVDSIWSWSVVDIRERERKRLRVFLPLFFLLFLFTLYFLLCIK